MRIRQSIDITEHTVCILAPKKVCFQNELHTPMMMMMYASVRILIKRTNALRLCTQTRAPVA